MATALMAEPGPRQQWPLQAPPAHNPSRSIWMVLDPIRSVFWEAFRHLFPPHARAVQTSSGALMISWSMKADPAAIIPYATPITLRFEDELIASMQAAKPEERLQIARRQEPVVRGGMVGYDPFAAVPKARVIVVG
jgi:hypothetical protein